MAKTFEHDSIVCHVRGVNARKEKHGEEDVLAVDVSLRLMDAGEWDPVLADLLGIHIDSVDEWRDDNVTKFDSVRFHSTFDEHKANFRFGADLLCSLTHAKINKFVMEFEDIGVTFRIQATASGDQVGALSELIGGQVRLEVIGPDQMDMIDQANEETADA